MSEIEKIVNSLDFFIKDPSQGLPDDIFLFISRVTPLINVDLLIRNEQRHTLLIWRDDGYCDPGWHVPGGIIRFKESAADRIKAVALTELGVDVKASTSPLAINEVLHPSRIVRGHFISLLYDCTLVCLPDEKYRYERGVPEPGQWAWHEKCPSDIITVHEMYRNYIDMNENMLTVRL